MNDRLSTIFITGKNCFYSCLVFGMDFICLFAIAVVLSFQKVWSFSSKIVCILYEFFRFLDHVLLLHARELFKVLLFLYFFYWYFVQLLEILYWHFICFDYFFTFKWLNYLNFSQQSEYQHKSQFIFIYLQRRFLCVWILGNVFYVF